MFNWIKALLLSAARWERNWADAERERERERGVCACWERNWADAERERERERCVRGARWERNWADAERERERERGVCACWERNWADAERERERERDREVCARAGRARPRATVPVTRFGRFFEGKKVAKGVCNVAKLATLCISISPTTGWATGQTENTRCVNCALKKFVPFDSTTFYCMAVWNTKTDWSIFGIELSWCFYLSDLYLSVCLSVCLSCLSVCLSKEILRSVGWDWTLADGKGTRGGHWWTSP